MIRTRAICIMRERLNVIHVNVGATKRAHRFERDSGEPARAGGAMSVRQHFVRLAALTGRHSLSRGARERRGDDRLRRQSETAESAKETG